MQTSIAQSAALTIFGNDILHGHPRLDFWPKSTVFTFCKRVKFVTLHGDPKAPTERLFADDPPQWGYKIRDVGTIGLRIHHFASNNPQITDRMSVGLVGGGGRWLIETLHGKLSDLWEARWRVENREDPERKIWDVVYCRVDQDRTHLPLSSESLTTLKSDLGGVLSRIDAFATARKNLEPFANAFRTAKSVLFSDDPLSKAYHFDLAPTFDLPLEAKQLLAAAQVAWVFGGMGSWNDLGFEKHQQEYIQISDELFALLNRVICNAVNSFPISGTFRGTQ